MFLATARDAWAVDDDAAPLVAALHATGVRAEPAVWDDPGMDWEQADLVVVRSTWDYSQRRAEFLDWADRVAALTELVNPPGVLRWNTDKTYLCDLSAAGLPVVPTTFLEPNLVETDQREELRGAAARFAAAGAVELVVKPSISAGSKDTGRWQVDQILDEIREADESDSSDGSGGAFALAQRIAASGRTTMLQPYLSSVDSIGETGLVYFGGELSHAFEKGPLLSPGTEATHGLFALETIAPRRPDGDELGVAEAVMAEVARRFGPLVYARVDLLRADDGAPQLLELELTEPSWFLSTDPASPARAAAAISSRLLR